MPYGNQARVSAVAIIMGTVAGVCYAQTEPGNDQLQEVVVTAQKREQNLQDVGVSVTALNQSVLRLINVKDATALANAVPSLQVSQFSPSLTVYNIRGVSQNDYSDIQEGPVAFYNDEVYIGTLGAISGQTFDLERVEVLRGPQGTLFGRNATGGLVQMVTNKPTSTWQGYGNLTYGSYSQVTAEAAVGGPISDSIRMRLSAISDNSDGYYRNLFPGGQDGGNTRFTGLRSQFDFDVGEHGLLRLKAEYLNNDNEHGNALNGAAGRQNADGLGVLIGPDENFFGNCAGCNVFGFRTSSDPFDINVNYPGRFERSYWNLSARYEQDLGAVQFTSISNYQHLTKQFRQDIDASPDDVIHVDLNPRISQLSQELRLAGQAGRLNWVTGLYGLKIQSDGISHAFVDPALPEFFAGVPFGTFLSVIDYRAIQTAKSLALFGQGEYAFNDTFTLIAGLRNSQDWKDMDFVHSNFGFVDYSFQARRPDLARQRFGSWSGKLQLNAQLNPDMLLYAGVNRGTKAGGFNTPNTVPSIFTIADPVALAAALNAFDQSMVFEQEVLTNYEGGFKLSLANRKVTLNGSLFHYHYSGYQSFQSISAAEFIVNLPVTETGAELELSARPLPGLMLGAFASHLFDATIHDVQLPGSGRIVDRDMPQAPAWTFGASASYEVPLGERGSLTFATNWKRNSSQYLGAFNAPVNYEGAYTVGDVRIGFETASRNLELAVFVNNVTDATYRVFNADNSFTSTIENVYGRPRWYGGSVAYRFGAH